VASAIPASRVQNARPAVDQADGTGMPTSLLRSIRNIKFDQNETIDLLFIGSKRNE